jgi:hypothetical protein
MTVAFPATSVTDACDSNRKVTCVASHVYAIEERFVQFRPSGDASA